MLYLLIWPLLLSQIAAIPGRFQTVLNTDSNCAERAHIVGVRGTLESPGFGALGDVVAGIQKKQPNTTSEALDYPASGITIPSEGADPEYNFTEYAASELKGYQNLVTVIEKQVEKCPETPIVLLGYSQGAHVLGDGMCGDPGFLFPFKESLPFALKNYVIALVQLGDPANVANLPWHVGTSTHGGIFPRFNFQKCFTFGPRFRSYCDEDDFFCDRGKSIKVHLGYKDRYLDDIVDWVDQQIKDVFGDE